MFPKLPPVTRLRDYRTTLTDYVISACLGHATLHPPGRFRCQCYATDSSKVTQSTLISCSPTGYAEAEHADGKDELLCTEAATL